MSILADLDELIAVLAEALEGEWRASEAAEGEAHKQVARRHLMAGAERMTLTAESLIRSLLLRDYLALCLAAEAVEAEARGRRAA